MGDKLVILFVFVASAIFIAWAMLVVFFSRCVSL
jgi:hypothetical protein